MTHVTPSRREVIAALALSSVAMSSGLTAATAPDQRRSRWNALIGQMKAAENEWQVYCATTYDPLDRDVEARFGRLYHNNPAYHVWPGRERLLEIGTLCDELCDAYARAEANVYDAEAPDAEALLWKIERMVANAESRDFDAHAEAILADCRRLLGKVRS